MRNLTTTLCLTLAVLLASAGVGWGDHLRTCLSGKYPSLCKRHLLTSEQAKQVDTAERSAPIKLDTSGGSSGGSIGGSCWSMAPDGTYVSNNR